MFSLSAFSIAVCLVQLKCLLNTTSLQENGHFFYLYHHNEWIFLRKIDFISAYSAFGRTLILINGKSKFWRSSSSFMISLAIFSSWKPDLKNIVIHFYCILLSFILITIENEHPGFSAQWSSGFAAESELWCCYRTSSAEIGDLEEFSEGLDTAPGQFW